jgi:hypothetical protein
MRPEPASCTKGSCPASAEDEYFVVADTGLVIGPLEADSGYEYAIGHESLSGLEAGAQVYVDQEYTYLPPVPVW